MGVTTPSLQTRPPRADEEAVGRLHVGPLGQLRRAHRGVELAVERLSHRVDVGERNLAALDREEVVAMLLDPDRHDAVPERGDARMKEAYQVHRVLPAIAVPDPLVGLELL